MTTDARPAVEDRRQATGKDRQADFAQTADGGGFGGKPTVEQLRADIDRGRTGDKVDGSDPAAVPLGTDEEAAGTPVSSAALAQARRRELGRAPVPPQYGRGLGAAKILFGFIIVLICALAAWAILKLS